MAVAAIALEHGADEDQAIAALLHDIVEDQGAHYRQTIAEQFGEKVLRIVDACTDGIPDATGNKPDWKTRKTAYLQHLSHQTADVLLVSGAGKLHNAQSILRDLRAIGPKVFDRFTASQAETLWYYRCLSETFTVRQVAIAKELSRVVGEIARLANIV
jgi:(p)ppGpp synthase/HD superfamily hydrolase